MAKVASPRVRLALVVAVTTPLWASYLVKAYAWRMLLSPEGPMAWATGYSPGYGLDRDGHHADLPVVAVHGHPGVRGVRARSRFARSTPAPIWARPTSSTLRMVVAPLVFPGIAAGSIFTFSLSLGDYIAVTIVGGKTQMLGNIIYGQLVTANNQPLAAALSIIPLAAIVAVPAGDAAHRRAGERLMLSTGARRAVRAWTVLVLVFLYAPLLLVVVNAFNASRDVRVPAHRFHASVVGRRGQQRGHVEVAGQFGGGRSGRDGDRACARHDGRVRRAALRVLRPQRCEFPCGACRLRCRASSPASRSTRRSPRCWA